MTNKFVDLYDENGINRKYTIVTTPQQNGVDERRNNLVKKMAREMMQERNIPQTYWEGFIYTTIHILNKVHLRPNCDKKPNELWHRKLASMKHFKVSNNKYYIKNNDEKLGTFNARLDE